MLNWFLLKREALIPGFYGWFDINRKTLFTETVIQSAREKADIQGLYCQNDVESQHAVEKCIQNYKKEDIAGATEEDETMSRSSDNMFHLWL